MSSIEDIEAVNDFSTLYSILEGNSNDQIQLELETRIRSHDKDIERICNLYYEGFINSIGELLHVRSQVKRLNEEVQSLYVALNTEASRMLMKENDLLRARQIDGNIANAIDGLSSCLPVLECYSKLLRQLKDKRYLPALTTLEHLENEQLPKVKHFRFTIQMKKSVPKLKENIKKWADAEFREFLENIRKCLPKIGEVTMQHTEQMKNRDLHTIIEEHQIKVKKEYAVDDGDLSVEDLVDFSPIYRCFQIHTVLNEQEYFEKDYRKQRREQAKLVLQPPQDMHDNLDDYKNYIYSIVGFFIVEDHVMHTAGDLVIRSYLDDLWSLSRIVNVLSISSSSCTNPNVLLGIKDLIVLFMATLKNYGYTVTQLWDMLLQMRDHYNDVLLERWVDKFRNLLEKGDFLPLQVNNLEYIAILERLSFHSEELENQNFPLKFPFSKIVPEVHHQVEEFMCECLKFSKELTMSPHEAAAMLRNAVNLLLTRTFSGCLSDVLRKPSLTLMQIIQIVIDTQYLEQPLFFDDFVCKMTGTQQAIKQKPSSIFQAVRSDAEMQVSGKLCSKLDDFFKELKKYDWLLAEPIGHASAFITDMLAFLQSTFQYFSYLQPEVAQAACKDAYEHIAKSFHQPLLSDDVKQISTGALQQLSLDLMQCEVFVGTDPVPGLEDGEALRYFAELRQLIDLLILEEWSAYLHDYGKTENRYNLVQSSTVIVVLEKLREVQDKKTMFSVLKKFERDKKKLWETVLKQMKQLGDRPK